MISPIANAVILLLLLSIPGGGYALFPYVIIFSVVGALRYRANHQSRQALISMLIAIVGLSLFAFRYSYLFWS